MPNKGYKPTEEHKNKLSNTHKGKKKPWAKDNLPKKHWALGTHHHAAETNPSWKGGHWKYWKTQALVRDEYICQICGFSERDIMEVDHIKQKSKYPELALSLDNLVTLCPNCHRRKTIRELKSQIPWNKKQ